MIPALERFVRHHAMLCVAMSTECIAMAAGGDMAMWPRAHDLAWDARRLVGMLEVGRRPALPPPPSTTVHLFADLTDADVERMGRSLRSLMGARFGRRGRGS